MSRSKIIVSFLLSCFFSTQAYSQPAPTSDVALEQTKDLLMNSKLRNEAITKDSDAATVDKKIYSLTKGSDALNEEVYSISADVLTSIVSDMEGDPQKISDLMEKAQKDPKGFYDSLNFSQKNRIRGLAGQIDLQNPSQNRK